MSEEELLELLVSFAPESLEGYLGIVVTVCAILSVALPAPSETCHPALRFGHRLIAILGLGAGRLRASGRAGAMAKAAGIFRKRK